MTDWVIQMRRWGSQEREGSGKGQSGQTGDGERGKKNEAQAMALGFGDEEVTVLTEETFW